MKKFQNITLKKKNIILKILTKDDYSHKYFKWLNDKNVNKYLETRFTNNTKKNIIEFIDKKYISADSYLFGIFENENNLLNHLGNIKIGDINFIHKYGFISYFIGEKGYWGKGYASISVELVTKFAFTKLKLNKCIAGVYQPNISSVKVLKKNNYELEGVEKNKLLLNNKFVSHLVFGKLNNIKI